MFRLKRPFKALIYDDTKYAHSRNRAIGTNYLNRFLIEEETQFECAGVVELRGFKGFEVSQYLKQNFKSHFDRFSNKSNSDSIGHLILSGEFLSRYSPNDFYDLWDFMQMFEDISHMTTRIGSQRLECVKKEHYDKLYNEGGQIKYYNDKTFGPIKVNTHDNEINTFDVHQSIGNDIDDFYDRIKMNKINYGPEYTDTMVQQKRHSYGRLLTSPYFKGCNFFGLIKSPHAVKTFHLSMLSDQQERKIGNREFHYFKNETTLSKKENYALSLCVRETVLMAPLENDKRIIRNIIEPDHWEERIKKNFEELQRLNKKRKAQENLEALQALEYYQTGKISNNLT